MESDYYAVLGVPPGAHQQQIAQAFRRLAWSSHPDARPEDPDAARRFREVAAAYDVLCDPARRAAYDRRRLQQSATDPPRPPRRYGAIRIPVRFVRADPDGAEPAIRTSPPGRTVFRPQPSRQPVDRLEDIFDQLRAMLFRRW